MVHPIGKKPYMLTRLEDGMGIHDPATQKFQLPFIWTAKSIPPRPLLQFDESDFKIYKLVRANFTLHLFPLEQKFIALFCEKTKSSAAGESAQSIAHQSQLLSWVGPRRERERSVGYGWALHMRLCAHKY